MTARGILWCMSVCKLNRRSCLTLLLCAPVAVRAARKEKLSREQCRKLREQIERIQSRLRAGYSAKQGRKLKARKRVLELRRYRQCR